jgi:hypothetical protein
MFGTPGGEPVIVRCGFSLTDRRQTAGTLLLPRVLIAPDVAENARSGCARNWRFIAWHTLNV